jgi:hypothetical protein
MDKSTTVSIGLLWIGSCYLDGVSSLCHVSAAALLNVRTSFASAVR